MVHVKNFQIKPGNIWRIWRLHRQSNKNVLIMLRTLTENLDFELDVLLPEVIFLIIKDILSISSKETIQLDGGIVY